MQWNHLRFLSLIHLQRCVCVCVCTYICAYFRIAFVSKFIKILTFYFHTLILLKTVNGQHSPYWKSISHCLPSQVGIGTNKTLYSLEDGIVKFTKEVYVPLPRSAEARDVIPKLPKGAVLYKTFINVIPIKQENKFKLVDMV